MAFLTNFSDTWRQLVELVIRPPRFNYDPNRDLGPKRFQFRGRHIIREDLELVNPRGYVLKCSHYQPIDPETRIVPGANDAEVLATRQSPKPCVVYCHGNAGSRVDAAMMLHGLLPHNISVFAFDFSGAGQSEGKYLSLGYYEKGDLATVVNHLRECGKVSRIGLWGHSMGAATCLLYAAGGGDAFVTSMVIDSAFSCLETIMSEIAANAKKKLAFDGLMSAVPDFFISMALSFMRKSIQTQANFDIRDVHPLSRVQRVLLPAIFIHGEKDEIVAPHHVDLLYENYAGDKTLVKFDGDHNSPRPDILHDLVSAFFVATLEGNRGDVFLYRSPSAIAPGAIAADDSKSYLGRGYSSGSDYHDGSKNGRLVCFHTGRSAATLALLVALCPSCQKAANKHTQHSSAQEGRGETTRNPTVLAHPSHEAIAAAVAAASAARADAVITDATTKYGMEDQPTAAAVDGSSISDIAERRASKLAELDALKREMRTMEAELKVRAQRRELERLRQLREAESQPNSSAFSAPENHSASSASNHAPSSGLSANILSAAISASGGGDTSLAQGYRQAEDGQVWSDR